MAAEMWIVIGIITLPLALVFWGRWRPDLAGFFLFVVLGIAQYAGMGILGPKDHPVAALLAISGFGQLLTQILVGLFILTQALSHNGVVLWLGQSLSATARRSVSRLVFLFTISAALLSLLMNTVAVGSLLLPSAIQAARKSYVKLSRLLIPVAFGTALGGMATYFTTANIAMSQMLMIAKPPQEPLNIDSDRRLIIFWDL